MRDTTEDARAAQVAALAKLGPEGRLRLAVELSEDARRIAIEGQRRRHPEQSFEEAQRAVLRLMIGEPLASRVWPLP